MSSATVKLNLVNQSADSNNSQVLIFQQNVTTSLQELVVAWQVIENLGHGWRHPFTYSYGVEVGAADSYGNVSPLQATPEGQLWTVERTTSGDQLVSTGPATSPQEVEIANGLSVGAISANIYRDGKLVATRSGVAPGQKAVFAFKPTIYIGVVSQVTEGQVLDAAILSSVNTEISLVGITAADIVLTGGGPGKDSVPFTFTLQNLQYGGGAAAPRLEGEPTAAAAPEIAV